jgi:hypothetical protein
MQVAVTKQIEFSCTFADIVPNPLAMAFALFFSLVMVLPSPDVADTGAITSAPVSKAVAAMTATIANIVLFILISKKHYKCMYIFELRKLVLLLDAEVFAYTNGYLN